MDHMKVTVLEDGSIKVETNRISQANHSAAEGFLRFLREICGGAQERKHKQGIIGAAIHAAQHALGGHHNH